MRPDEEHDSAEGGPGRRPGRFGLFYFEVGSRHYLRFTRLALILIVCLVLISVVLLFTLYLSRKRSGPQNMNVDIVVPTRTPHDYNKIQPVAPPPTPPKVRTQPGAGVPPQQTPLAPNGNAGGVFTPSPTPSPALARPPTRPGQ